MAYSIQDIDKIVEFSTWNGKKKIDELLRIDCSMYANLGIDSSKKDRETVKINSRKIYRYIKKINPRMGREFLNAMDKEEHIE
tara:strand:+ start:12049 stop:12297 length:249 start_codon:yes stop_codon:yes gene_type:complete